jgi:hypothetical protein
MQGKGGRKEEGEEEEEVNVINYGTIFGWIFSPRAETGRWDSYVLDINMCSDILLCTYTIKCGSKCHALVTKQCSHSFRPAGDCRRNQVQVITC